MGTTYSHRARRWRLGEVSEFEAVGRRNQCAAGTLKDRHKFKTEMDEEALQAMFPHLKVKAA
jgi:hypothetical protein